MIETRDDLTVETVDSTLMARFPLEYLTRGPVAPLRRENGNVVVAVSDTAHAHLALEVAGTLGAPPRIVVAPAEAIRRAIRYHYGLGQRHEEEAEAAPAETEGDLKDLLEIANDAPVVKLVQGFLARAARDRSSDIHIEPYEKETKVRYRIDGVLHEAETIPKRLHPAVVSRIKVMANLDIAERRLPQDGRILLRGADEKEWDLRVSVLPTAHGERVVLRLLDRASVLLGLGDLGLRPQDQERIRRLIALPHGMLLVTGPTGSGKSTTLYAVLHEVRSPERNVMTVEDPVEYEIPGIAQMPVRPQIGLDFATGLRAILRQDPDVVMVGEIRDSDTVRVAIQASLTGHLVLSTLHTNDAAGAPARLLDMGAEPYLLATSLVGVVAQRLVRTVCDACAAPVSEGGISFRRGKGCERCRGTGYLGRVGIFEMIEVDDAVRALIVERAPAATFLEAVEKAGRLHTLRDDGMEKVRAGRTTPEEVVRVTTEA